MHPAHPVVWWGASCWRRRATLRCTQPRTRRRWGRSASGGRCLWTGTTPRVSASTVPCLAPRATSAARRRCANTPPAAAAASSAGNSAATAYSCATARTWTRWRRRATPGGARVAATCATAASAATARAGLPRAPSTATPSRRGTHPWRITSCSTTRRRGRRRGQRVE